MHEALERYSSSRTLNVISVALKNWRGGHASDVLSALHARCGVRGDLRQPHAVVPDRRHRNLRLNQSRLNEMQPYTHEELSSRVSVLSELAKLGDQVGAG